MKLTSLFVLCLVALATCRIVVDDFLSPVELNHDTNQGNFKDVTTADSSLYYSRRITSYKGHPEYAVDVQVAGGQMVSVVNTGIWTVGDYILVEYFFDETLSPVTRLDNPFPNRYRDFSGGISLMIDLTFGVLDYPGISFVVIGKDLDGSVFETGYNYDRNPDPAYFEIPSTTLFVFGVDPARVTYLGFRLLLNEFVFHNLYFTEPCTASANVNSEVAIPIAVNFDVPVSLIVATCATCNPGVFTGFDQTATKDNVFWYSIDLQNDAYSLTLSSSSFAGYDDAYLWVFDNTGRLLASIDNLHVPTFQLSLIVNDVPVFIAFGAECSIETFTLIATFSRTLNDCALSVEELGENLAALISAGYDALNGQVSDLSEQLTNSETAITNQITSSELGLQDFITTKTDQINTGITTLSTDIGDLDSSLTTHIDDQFTTLTTALDTNFGNIDIDLEAISDLITDTCGSSVDGITSLTNIINSQWNNWKIQQTLDKFVVGALVPAHYQTPVNQGGELENIYTFVINTFNTKKNLADSQRTAPTATTCLAGNAGSYCTFFYRFPTGTGSALSIYQTAIAAYNSWVSQARYAKAFLSLAQAYNSLFMGQA